MAKRLSKEQRDVKNWEKTLKAERNWKKAKDREEKAYQKYAKSRKSWLGK
jgi:hypothetical protein